MRLPYLGPQGHRTLKHPQQAFKGRGSLDRIKGTGPRDPQPLGSPNETFWNPTGKMLHAPPDFQIKLSLCSSRPPSPQTPIFSAPRPQAPKCNVYVHFHLVNKWEGSPDWIRATACATRNPWAAPTRLF